MGKQYAMASGYAPAAVAANPSPAVIHERVSAARQKDQSASGAMTAAIGSAVSAAAAQSVTVALASRLSAAGSGVEYASRLQVHHARRE